MTTELTPQQLQSCITSFHIREEAEIVPLGLKVLGSGIDDAIWFKFETDSPDPSLIFQTEFVPAETLQGETSFFGWEDMPEWWDTRNRVFSGGTVTLEYGSVMSIGFQQEPDRIICYIFYHET